MAAATIGNTVNMEALVTDAAFADLDTHSPSLRGEPPIDWSSDYLNKIPMWSDLAYDTPQIIVNGEGLLRELTTGQITTRTAIKGLRLAMSLRSMNPSSAEYLLRQPIRVEAPTDDSLPRMPLPAITNFSGTAFNLPTAAATGGQPQLPTTATTQNNDEENHDDGLPAPDQDDDTIKRASYSFLAAYLMKLLVKSIDNVAAGIRNMQERFFSFYGPSRIIVQFTCTAANLKAYNDALRSQIYIMNSHTVAIAHTHQVHFRLMDQQEQGVLSYLCFLPFAYTGMHAYTMMIELQIASRMPLDKLLSLFKADVTMPALKKIAEIIKTSERTTQSPNKNITFRYCAPWGAHYFAEVRSKNCPHLIFTLACAMKQLKDSTDYADPENIAATKVLSPQMKQTLKRAGVIIGLTLKKHMLSGTNSSPAFALAVDAGNEADPVDDEDIWTGLN